MSDHADNAAAVAAGWTRLQIDRGVLSGRKTQFQGVSRYRTEYQKHTSGDPDGGSGASTEVAGESNSSQAAADTAALAALNGLRRVRYGAGATGRKGSTGTGTHSFDVT